MFFELISIFLALGIAYVLLELAKEKDKSSDLEKELESYKHSIPPLEEYNKLVRNYREIKDKHDSLVKQVEDLKAETANLLKLYNEAKKKPTKPRAKKVKE